MRRSAIRLALPTLVLALLLSQLLVPRYVESRIADRLTEHGGTAQVEVSAFPALRLLFGGGKLEIEAQRLSVDLEPGRRDVFGQLERFSAVDIEISQSRAGPFAIAGFSVRRTAEHAYTVTVAGDGAAGDVARYAGDRLGGGFGGALAGLAAAALGAPARPIPFDARMAVDIVAGKPRAREVTGQVGGFPAGALAQVVANALLHGL